MVSAPIPGASSVCGGCVTGKALGIRSLEDVSNQTIPLCLALPVPGSPNPLGSLGGIASIVMSMG